MGLRSLLTEHEPLHGHGKTAFADSGVKDLWRLDEEVRAPPKESVSEEEAVRNEANKNASLPRIEGDTVSLQSAMKDEAMESVRECFKATLALKQAVQDEYIDPVEMNDIYSHMGRCASSGSELLKQLYGGQNPRFAFRGQLPGSDDQKVMMLRPWAAAKAACDKEAAQAAAASSTPTDAAQMLVKAGHCMAALGEAFVRTPVRHMTTSVSEASADASLIAVAPVPAMPDQSTHRLDRRQIGAEFLCAAG
eukprot:gb/GFBE01068633.1/.p1 GENE.gb/GFBE01068633.1/~~gb/GFBE01068633.1/.p1  ORF type:complete len:250 (+),score=53.86 gb/GFBE01068633.1/:1-750(+)